MSAAMVDPITLRQIPTERLRLMTQDAAQSDLHHYQRETRRLAVETESQRREIVLLRKDLATALALYVRATSALDHSEALLRSPKETPQDKIRKMLGDWHGAASAFREIHLGTREEILARIDALNRPIPENP
jgi:hypothetical protein